MLSVCLLLVAPLELVWSERYAPPERAGEVLSLTCLAASDGDRPIFCGSTEGWVICVGTDGRAIWGKQVGGDITGVASGDLDGDGRDEVVVGRMWPPSVLLDDDALRLWQDGESAIRVACADLFGDGKPEALLTGPLSLRAVDRYGGLRWRLDLDGEVRHSAPVAGGMMVAGDDAVLRIDAHGAVVERLPLSARRLAAAEPDLLAALTDGALVCWRHGAERWQVTGLEVTALAATDGAVVVGTGDGRLVQLDTSGETVAQVTLPGGVLDLVAHGRVAVAVVAGGRLVRVRLR